MFLILGAAALLTFTGLADILDWVLALEPVDLTVPLVFEAGLDWAVCFGDAFTFEACLEVALTFVSLFEVA